MIFFYCVNKRIVSQKKEKSIAEESLKDFKICSHDLINVLNYENKNKSDSNLSTINFDKIQNNAFNSVDSQFLSKQLASNLVKKKTDNNTKNSYHIDLTSISKSGVFSLAPIVSQSSIMIESSNKESIKIKSVKNIQNKIKLFGRTLFKPKRNKRDKIYCLYNMTLIQQRYLLNFYGKDKNPVLLAREDYKRKLKSKQINFDSIGKKRESIDSEIFVDNLSNQVQSYLKNSNFSNVIKYIDNGGDLGRKSIYRIRKLEYRDLNFLSKKRIKRQKKGTLIPRINIELYNIRL